MGSRTYDIRYDFLSDEDSDRLYARHPDLKASSDEYCPTCQKTGTYLWQDEIQECDCALQLQLHKHYLHAGIGVTYQRLNWDDYVGNDDIKASVQAWLAKHEQYIPRGEGLLFVGEHGTGKTMLANLILKELVRSGYDCYATTFASTIESFTAGWTSKTDKDWFARRFMFSQVLLLDDLGKERRATTNLSESTFDNIIRTRTQEGRSTILTSNMTSQALGTGYGAGALSNLTETVLEYQFEEADYRPVAAARKRQEMDQGETRPIF